MPPRPNVQIHDVNPFLQKVRDFLLGRSHTLSLRFQDCISSRSPPPPVLPDGPAHRLAGNYYFTRDARREVKPPEVLAPLRKQIEAGEVSDVKRIVPGKMWKWD